MAKDKLEKPLDTGTRGIAKELDFLAVGPFQGPDHGNSVVRLHLQ